MIIPIRVITLANLIDEVDLMLNYILIMPCVVVLSYTPVSSLWNVRNWLYFTVDYLDISILIIMPIKLSAV